jgi:hypothetical protein
MAQTFQRLRAPAESLEGGQYTVDTYNARPAMCCPACSNVFELPKGINYDAAGLTNYCVTCPAQQCGWWSYCVLDGISDDP